MRERWFGATGRRVPEIALDGELELAGALVLDSPEADTRHFALHTPRAGRSWYALRTPTEVKDGARTTRGRMRARHRPGAARPRPDGADLWLSRTSRRTRSSPAISRPGPVGRRDAIEVPRRRLDRAVGRARRRGDRHPVVREPAVRPRRACAAARGRSGRRGRTEADRRRRRPRSAPGRGRRPPRPRRHVHRHEVHGLGRRHRRRVFRRSGEHPRRRGDGRRARRHVLGNGRAARSPSACSTASPPRRPRAATGAGQQSAALLVVERDARVRRALRHPRRPARRRPRESRSRRSRASTRCTPCCSGSRRRSSWLPSTTSCARELSDRLSRLGYGGRLAGALADWAGNGEPRGARRRHRADRPGRARGASPAGEVQKTAYEVAHVDDLEAIPVSHGLVWRPVRQAIRRARVRRQRVHERGGRRPGGRGAHREPARPRGDLPRASGQRDVHARRRGGRGSTQGRSSTSPTRR